MSGAELLLVCVAALYLVECMAVLRPEELLFEKAGERWRERPGGIQLGGLGVRLVFTHPLAFGATQLIARKDGPLEGQPGPDAVRANLRAAEDVLAPLRADGAMLAVFAFVVAPLIVLLAGLSGAWLPILLGACVLVGCVIADFRYAHDALCKGRDGEWSAIATMVVSPAAAMRAHQLFARPLASGYHALVVASALCDAPELRRIAAAELRDRGSDPEIESMLVRLGASPTDLREQPRDRDETARTYCPSCFGQYSLESGWCADCDGMALVGFAPSGALQPAVVSRPAD